MNGTISQKQGIVMIIMFIIGSSSLMVMGLEAKMDIWLAIILAMAVSALIMLVYAKILTALPGKDFFETINYFFGKIGSKIVFIILTWFSFDLCAIVLRNYSQFVVTVGLPETPIMVAILMMISVCIYSVRSGIETIGRWSEQFVIYLIAFMALSVLLVSSNMNINNLLPVLDSGAAQIAKGALGVVTFPFAETVVFLLVFPAFKKGASVKKVFLKGLLIGGLTIFITSMADILVLGADIAENMYYPTYAAMAIVHYGEFLQRFEVVAAIVFIIAVFLKLSILLFGACNGISRIFGFKDHRFIVFPTALLIICFAIFPYDSMIYYHDWIVKVWPYYSPFFEIIVPITLLVIIQIKLRKKRKNRPSDI